MTQLRRLLSALCLAATASGALPLAVDANMGPTMQWGDPLGIGAEPLKLGQLSMDHSHQCADGSRRRCEVEDILRVPEHYEVTHKPPPNTPVYAMTGLACGRHYGWPSYEVDDHNYLGQVITRVTLSGEDWWDGCTSGWAWTSLSCSAAPGYSCGAGAWGSFWDPGLGAATAWGNQPTTSSCCRTTWYLRMDIYPGGSLRRRYSTS